MPQVVSQTKTLHTVNVCVGGGDARANVQIGSTVVHAHFNLTKSEQTEKHFHTSIRLCTM